jgi:hypothetical protein
MKEYAETLIRQWLEYMEKVEEEALAIIWGAVLVTALSTGAYVNAAINERVAQSQAEQLQPAATAQQIQPAGTIEVKTYNPQQTINGKELQGN